MKRIKKFFMKKPVRSSNIVTRRGEERCISTVYQNLVDRQDIHITSVSITRVDSLGSKGYRNEYMIAVSYDYYSNQ